MEALIRTNLIENGLLQNIFPGFETAKEIFYQISPEELISQSVEKGEGFLTDSGALIIDTGELTGRSPKDRFIVKEAATEEAINWNEFNLPIEEKYFNALLHKVEHYLKNKKLWIRDCYTCAKPQYRVTIRVINENPCCNLFAYNMFIRPKKQQSAQTQIDWHLVQVPYFFAEPGIDGVPNKNFVIIHFTKKIILIGGTQYTGEMKRRYSVF